MSAVAPALPREQTLSKEIEDATAAQDRGYYLPDEDERLRDTYSVYLGLRTSLWETVLTLRPLLDERRNPDWGLRMRVFGLAFCATAMLMRSAGFIVSLAKDRPVVWKKLDEAEGRYGIEEKSLTGIYRNFSSARWMWRYHEAWRFYETHQKEIAEALESSGMAQVAEWLQAEEPFFEKSRREFIKRKIRYRIHAFKLRQVAGYKRVMFHLFRISGSAIADMKQPFIRRTQKAHRVSSEICLTAASKLCPGDVLVTRHDDAMSNLFLPGFWPHTSLYLGNLKQRDALGLPPIRSPETEVLEAKKDGVLFRHLTEARSLCFAQELRTLSFGRPFPALSATRESSMISSSTSERPIASYAPKLSTGPTMGQGQSLSNWSDDRENWFSPLRTSSSRRLTRDTLSLCAALV